MTDRIALMLEAESEASCRPTKVALLQRRGVAGLCPIGEGRLSNVLRRVLRPWRKKGGPY